LNIAIERGSDVHGIVDRREEVSFSITRADQTAKWHFFDKKRLGNINTTDPIAVIRFLYQHFDPQSEEWRLLDEIRMASDSDTVEVMGKTCVAAQLRVAFNTN
jgi:hypothetical protein